VSLDAQGAPVIHQDMLSEWRGDGIITSIWTPEVLAMYQRRKEVVVSVSNVLPTTPLPSLADDDLAVGRMAATHFIEQGVQRLIWYGPDDTLWGQLRREGFSQAAKAAAVPVDQVVFFHSIGKRSDRGRRLGALQTLLSGMREPVGLMGANDRYAHEAMSVCRKLGLRIPSQVAVVGVDNDDMICLLADPPLSSIASSGPRMGFEAAQLLDRLMNGETAPRDVLLLPPLGVVRRESSDIVTVADEHVAEAVRFIRAHATEPIGVKDLLRRIPRSRRYLEMKFAQLMKRTIHEEIRRAHIEHARHLLSGTTDTVGEVARRSGYNALSRFMEAFQKETGQTPGAYRRKAGAKREDAGRS
jgi:LacI family transcriptional regulator